MINIIRKGSSGVFVSQWQAYLRGQGFIVSTDGLFGDKTEAATLAFQKTHQLEPDGIVGNQTLGAAGLRGFEIVDYVPHDTHFPAKPTFSPITSTAQRQNLFGPLEFAPTPSDDNPEKIKITNDFEKKNIVRVAIPQLKGVAGAPVQGKVLFHHLVQQQFVNLWSAWDTAGLLDKILSFDGSYAPRFVRGKADQQILSNHAFGTAFDINAQWNAYGSQPATWGQQGCVYNLVGIAAEHGFYWGGFFSHRDGMHFEVAKIIS
ncbi:M15 family metallopeptidase [Enterobacter sp. K16B]|uniref:M15 family metallopeptidase n=1 Tax=Enterobacter sp. K16B TaxID=2878537 RepID=UPI001CDA19D5|nr:M15 family metallopeptidase [Enterobacter sp. K16B]MCA2024852.1 M15 family metallopeptidase [Enterobacter sp. K16B]